MNANSLYVLGSIFLLVVWFAGLAWIEAFAQNTPAPVSSELYRHPSHIELRLYQLAVLRERRVRWRQSFLTAFFASLVILLALRKFTTVSFVAVLAILFGAIEIPRRVSTVHTLGLNNINAGYLYAALAEKHCSPVGIATS